MVIRANDYASDYFTLSALNLRSTLPVNLLFLMEETSLTHNLLMVIMYQELIQQEISTPCHISKMIYFSN